MGVPPLSGSIPGTIDGIYIQMKMPHSSSSATIMIINNSQHSNNNISHGSMVITMDASVIMDILVYGGTKQCIHKGAPPGWLPVLGYVKYTYSQYFQTCFHDRT